MISALEIKKELQKVCSKERAKSSAWFFKTNKGQYGEGDVFIGVTVPEQRKVAKNFYQDINLSELQKLLRSEIHEHRLVALLILVFKFKKSREKRFVDFYLKNLKYINNWDLIDLSSYHILGVWLFDKKDRKVLYKLAHSKDFWENRIAIVSTYVFIKNNSFEDTLKISEILLNHRHDLIHKAVGWMLREVGNRDLKTEELFLRKYYKQMPRTMLRYAIEKFPEAKRQRYLRGKV